MDDFSFVFLTCFLEPCFIEREKQTVVLWFRCRSVAEERVATVARSEGAHVTGRTERVSSSWGWTGLPNGRGKRESGHASMSPKKEPMSRAENRRGAQGGRREPGSELTARIRRNIRFLEECDRWAHNHDDELRSVHPRSYILHRAIESNLTACVRPLQTIVRYKQSTDDDFGGVVTRTMITIRR